MSTIQSRIEVLMNQKSMKSTEVARKIGVSHTTIARILNGSTPTSNTLYELSKLFGVTMEYLLLGADAPSIPCAGAHDNITCKFSELFSTLSNDDKDEIMAIINLKVAKAEAKKETKLSTSEDKNNMSGIA